MGLFSVTHVVAQEKVNSLKELKEIQLQVKAVAAKNMTATVSIATSRGASGSGVIVSKDGLILTAAHVVRGAEVVDIIFPDGKSAKAKVLGANYSKDSAMCQMIKPGPWKFAEVADSKNLKIGEYVVAMGHAGGFDAVRTPPVRFGRVLSKNTNFFVTTDCTLIGGDSGGPLYDLKGRVVGIHSNIGNLWSINNHAGTSGFKAEWDRLKKGEQWGALSVNPMTNPDSPAIGIQMRGTKDGGVEIGSILPKGPADKSGMKAKDIIMKLNGKAVKSPELLIGAIMKHNAGDTVKLTIKRGDETKVLDLVLGRREQLKGFIK